MRTQDDIVKHDQGFQPQEVTDRVTIPGIELLHEKSTDEIAEVLTMVLRSRPNIRRFTYVVGSHFEITTVSD